MNKLTNSNLLKLSEYLSSHREKTSLSLKVKLNANSEQNPSIIKVIEEELNQLTHLTDLSLHISKYSILTAEGYRILSNPVLKMKALKKLSLDIGQSCFLENEGLSVLQNLINNLQELVSLNLKVRVKNYINTKAAQQFLDSLAANTQLTTLNLHFEEIESSSENEGNIHFWRGLLNLHNLKELELSFNNKNKDSSDIIELFECIANLQNLRSLSLNITNSNTELSVLDELFPQIGKMIELRSLKINYIHWDYTLKDQQRETILKNLSNLKFLEYLQLNSLEQHLFEDSFGGYINLIKDLTYLKELSLHIKNKQVFNNEKTISLGKTLLALNNLTHLEFKLEQKDSYVWRGFFSYLSSSLKEMHNLLSLNLEFKSEMSQKGCNILGESFLHLQQLEKLELSIVFETKVNKSMLLHNLRKVSNLKELQLFTPYANFYLEEEILFDSISQLNQLEQLCLVKCDHYNIYNIDWIRNLEALSNALKNLRKLKQLAFGLCIQHLNSQNQLNQLEQCFENLSNLETLNLYLKINEKSIELQNVSIIKNLSKLESLAIVFHDLTLNLFRSAAVQQERRQIENIIFMSIERMQPQDFIEMFESLSELVTKKLFLRMNLTDSLEHREQFGNACSKLRNLKKLSISEEGQGNLMQHIDLIKQMKFLKSLDLSSCQNSLANKEIQRVNETLLSLKNLQKLSISLNTTGEMSDILSFQQLKYFSNLKQLYFSFNLQNEDSRVNKTIEFVNACYLDQSQCNTNQNLDYNQMQSQDLILKQEANYFQENQLKNEDNLSVFANKLNPININIDIQHENNNKEKTITLSELDFINFQYLNNFQMRSLFGYLNPVTIQLLQPMRDLQSYSKLTNLDLEFESLIFNQEQLLYFSRIFQFLTNLKSFKFTSTNCWDDDHLLFDSFKYLVNLDSIEFYINISDNGAISLGNSLKSMTKLQDCLLIFQENYCSLGLAGISSIFSGLKQLTNMKSLKLRMKTEQVLKDYQINLSECLSNMKCLECLYFNLEIDSIGQSCLREFITSIGSIRKLSKLNFRVSYTNFFNQDMIDELIKAMNQLTLLKSYNILIYLEDNVSIKLSEEFATFFNRNFNDELTIKTISQEIHFFQSDNICSFMYRTIEKFEVGFLEFLNERVPVKFSLEDHFQILKNAKLSLTKNVQLIYEYATDKEIEILHEFLSNATNIFEIRIALFLNNNSKTEDSIIKIAQTVAKLPNLKVITLSFYHPYNQVYSTQLRKALDVLKDMQQLQEVYLQKYDEEENKYMIPFIQKSILRLVKFDQSKQIQVKND